MASKGKRNKQQKALKRRLRKKANAIPVLDDLGSHFTEFLLRAVYIYSLRHGQESIPQVTARIKDLVSEKRFDKLALVLGVDKMPREKAQILAYRAMASQDPARARQLIVRALELDPSNMDAHMWLARHDFETSQEDCAEILGRMQAIVDLGAQIHGPQVHNMQGRLHEIPIARPYLRALNTLFTTLVDCHKHQEALVVGQKLVSLCSGDMFDIKARVDKLRKEMDPVLGEPKDSDSSASPETGEHTPDVPTDPKRAAIFQELTELIEDFCSAYKVDTLFPLARKATLFLCRDESCPVHRGKRTSWASGIVHALTQINGMLGPSGSGEILPVQIHTHFKVSSSTTTKKSSQIKKLLDMDGDPSCWLLS